MKNNSLCIGDVVLFSENGEGVGTKFVITHIDQKTGYVSGIGADGNMFADKNPSKWKKTGDYCPVVEELLDVLQTLK